MNGSRDSTFRRSALASGLLTIEQLREAVAALRLAGAPAGTPPPIGDEQLAAKLVELGWLNPWQIEQLKAGRTKFNLGPYQVIDSIGQGGMGQVFKGEHRMMGRVVAIKVLPRHRSTPDAITNFTREIRAQAQLDHENLVRAYDAGHDGNVYFLVTEYVPGTDLRKFVRARGRLSMQEAATIISQAATGLEHAHSRGLIHRDVKPGNLLVTPSGHTKVSDLGLAGFIEELDHDPRSGKVVGTADYLSPEHIQAPRNISPASDVYSLGCTLYYAVTGKVPFPGGTTREKARRHCEDTPLNPRLFNPQLSPEFVDVLAAMMEKDPKQRIQTAAAVVERLAPWAGEAVSTTLADMSERSAGSSLSRTPSVPELSDTQPSFFDELLPPTDDSPSQLSQGTDPVASAAQETLPDVARQIADEEPAGLPLLLMILSLTPVLLAAAVLVASLIFHAVQ